MAHLETMPSITPSEFHQALCILKALGFDEDPEEVLDFFQKEAHVAQGHELDTDEETNKVKEVMKLTDEMIKAQKK